MSDESIRPGYKRTEVGVLPEDWTVSPLSSIAFVTSGKRLPKGHSLTDQETPHPYIRVSDMRPGTVSLANIRYVPENVFPLIQNYRIFKEDIFISVAGTLGIIGEVPPELNGANLTENADRITNISCSKRYLLHVLTSPLIQNVIDSVQTVGAQPKLALTRIRNFAIPLPPTQEEQHTIAEALSDVDAMLDALDRLIAKKRMIKQGAMQALLTGRVRLPGFMRKPGHKRTELGVIPRDWVISTLGEVADSLDHLRVPLNEKQRAAMPGPYPYCGANGVLDFIGDYVLDDDVILMAEDGGYFEEFATRPIAYRMSGKIWVNNHVHILQAKIGVDQGYLFYSIVHKNILPYISSGTRSKLNKGELVKIEVALPGDEREQVAIAEVLSDIDTEIDALEKRRTKWRDIKQGMMQELLTGRIRLVQPQQQAQEAHV